MKRTVDQRSNFLSISSFNAFKRDEFCDTEQVLACLTTTKNIKAKKSYKLELKLVNFTNRCQCHSICHSVCVCARSFTDDLTEAIIKRFLLNSFIKCSVRKSFHYCGLLYLDSSCKSSSGEKRLTSAFDSFLLNLLFLCQINIIVSKEVNYKI